MIAIVMYKKEDEKNAKEILYNRLKNAKLSYDCFAVSHKKYKDGWVFEQIQSTPFLKFKEFVSFISADFSQSGMGMVITHETPTDERYRNVAIVIYEKEEEKNAKEILDKHLNFYLLKKKLKKIPKNIITEQEGWIIVKIPSSYFLNYFCFDDFLGILSRAFSKHLSKKGIVLGHNLSEYFSFDYPSYTKGIDDILLMEIDEKWDK